MNTAMAEAATQTQRDWSAEVEALDPNDREAVRRMVDRVPLWWHTIDLGNGLVTPGKGLAQNRLDHLELPDLRGKSVLDIGAWDGQFSFEAERRGAARVVAADFALPQGFVLARKVLGSNVEFVAMDLRRPDGVPEGLGTFDVVLFLGVLYHVPNPVEVLLRVSALTGELMVLETDTDFNWYAAPVARLVAGHHRSPHASPRQAVDDPGFNWWVPNRACVERLVDAAGFDRYEQVFGPPRAPTGLGRKLLWKAGRFLPESARAGRPETFGGGPNRLIAHCWKR